MSRRIAPTLVALSSLALLAGCAPKPETPEQAQARMTTESAAARTAIEARNAAFMGHTNAGHADSVAAMYTEQGVLMPPNQPAATGRDAIKAAFQQMMATPGGTLALHTVDVAANGPMAIERGNWTYDMPAQGRTPAMHAAGKYLVHWHNVSGTWMLAEDIWNDDAPMTPPAPPARH